MTPAEPPLIDARLAVLLQTGVSMTLSACDDKLMPTLARACGCRIAPDRRRVTMFISAVQAAPVLACIRQNGAVAVAFSQPSTHRTVQLKGKDAVVGELAPGDTDILVNYRYAFAHELSLLGYDHDVFLTLLALPPAEIVTISFTPSEAYSQTPGPKAGKPLTSEEG